MSIDIKLELIITTRQRFVAENRSDKQSSTLYVLWIRYFSKRFNQINNTRRTKFSTVSCSKVYNNRLVSDCLPQSFDPFLNYEVIFAFPEPSAVCFRGFVRAKISKPRFTRLGGVFARGTFFGIVSRWCGVIDLFAPEPQSPQVWAANAIVENVFFVLSNSICFVLNDYNRRLYRRNRKKNLSFSNPSLF